MSCRLVSAVCLESGLVRLCGYKAQVPSLNSTSKTAGIDKECCASSYRMGGYEDVEQINRGA